MAVYVKSTDFHLKEFSFLKNFYC